MKIRPLLYPYTIREDDEKKLSSNEFIEEHSD